MRLPKHHLGQAAQASEVIFAANSILKEMLNGLEGVEAYKLELGKLFVSAPSAVVRQEVWGVQHKLLAQLQVRFGAKQVQKIVLHSSAIKSGNAP